LGHSSSEAQSFDEVTLLYELCHAFASAHDQDEAYATVVRSVQAAIGSRPVPVRIFVPDRLGRLRLAMEDGDRTPDDENGSEVRRQVFQTKSAARQELRGKSGRSRALLPLVNRGEAEGLLEVVGPSEVVAARWKILEAVAAQAAIAFRNLPDRGGLQPRTDAIESATQLLIDLVGADSPRAAVEVALRFCGGQFHVPAAAWLSESSATRLSLVGIRGVKSKRRAQIRRSLPQIPRWGPLSEMDRNRFLAHFATAAGVGSAMAVDAGRAVILVGAPSKAVRRSLGLVGIMVQQVLSHLSTVRRAVLRNRHLDLGVASTAHELRNPILGVKAAIEKFLSNEPREQTDLKLLRQSKEELDELASTVEGLLNWAVGERSLSQRRTNLARVVREAVDSSSHSLGTNRVSLTGPSRVIVRADGKYLKLAVANVVRNALAHSPPQSAVRVEIGRDNGLATVTVRDEGPGVPEEKRESIFDPLVADVSRGARGGRGLGLFIARQILKAHGGTIWLKPSARGATFRIGIPSEVGGRKSESSS